MIKIVVISVLAACAMGMEMPGGLGGLMGSLGGLGGMLGNAKNLLGNLGNIDMDQISSMMSNLKPDDLTRALENMPPQMMEMAQSFGITKEQIKEAAKQLPEHMDEIKSVVGEDGFQDMMKNQLSEGLGVPVDGDMKQAFKGVQEQVTKQMKEIGIDVEKGNMKSIMPQVVKLVKKEIKQTGIDIDLDNPKKLKGQVKKILHDTFDIDEDAKPKEVKRKLLQEVSKGLGEMGMEIDIEKPEEAIAKLTDILKEQGLELKDGATRGEVMEAIRTKAKTAGFDMSNTNSMMKSAMGMLKKFLPSIMGPAMQQMPPMQQMPHSTVMMAPRPQMMQPRPQMMQPHPQMMQPHPQMMSGMPFNLNLEINVDGGDHPTNIGLRRPGPPSRFPAYLHGAEQALLYAHGDEDNVIRHVMNAHQGISSGIITEGAVEELLRDLMHFRMKARVLMAKNHMLEEALMRQRMARPAIARSSQFLQGILSKSEI